MIVVKRARPVGSPKRRMVRGAMPRESHIAMFAVALSLSLSDAASSQQPKAALRTGEPSTNVLAEQAVKMPMRDGVTLVGTVFRPTASAQSGKKQRFPVILARTPYGRQIEATVYGKFFAKHGYAFVAQDVRGRFDSEGSWTPFRHERSDGVDSIDWLIRQPWCDGSVAMFGASYGAVCAWHAATAAHPNLRAVIAMVNVADPDQFMPFEGGVFHIGYAGWAKLLEAIEKPGGTAMMPLFDWNRAARVRPLSELDSFFGTSHKYVDEVLAKPLSDREYWQRISYQHDLSNARVAGLHITGWYDVHRKGTFSAYERLRRHAATQAARDSQYLIVGPWAHLGVNRSRTMGGVDFGKNALIDLNGMMLKFLDDHMNGDRTSWNAMKRVRLFVAGPNRWHEASDWPLPNATPQKLFLASAGTARKRGNDGCLRRATNRPSKNEFDEFIYDPDDPPPFLGSMALYPIPAHVNDKSSETDRPDVLDYTSDAFAEPMESIGAVRVVLHVSTSAEDTDFAVELFRLTKEGKMFRLTGGIQRLRFRRGYDQDQPVTAGRIAKVVIDCPPIGLRLEEGDRLHLQIGSAAAPAFAPHLNTLEPIYSAKNAVVATNRVWHAPKRESYLAISLTPRPK